MDTPHSGSGSSDERPQHSRDQSYLEKPPYSRDQSYVHESLLPSEQPRPKRSRKKWIIGSAIIAVIVLAIALSVGLGVGLSRRSSSPTGPSTSGLPTSPGNSSDITSTITRAELLGDQSRWQMSNRNFTISGTPTTRVFNWTLSEVIAAPGGMEKPMIVINGLSPGPMVEANLGDTLVFNIYNNMTNETSMHWHGQYLFNQNFMDGTFGITQCGHTPGRMLTYNWTVQNVGTSWYHAHKGTQYTDGMYGPLVFHAPNETAMTANPYFDDYTVMIGDMYNTQGSALDWRYQALGTGLTGNPGDEPVPDGGLMNGVSQASCAYIPASNSVLAERKRSTNGGTVYPETNYCGNFTTDYWNVTFVGNHTYRIRIINPGTFLDAQFSIDNHTLTVIEADGVSVEPREVSAVDLGIAQRYSVLVTLNQTPGAYWIRNTLDVLQQARYYSPGWSGTTLGILRYAGIPDDQMPAINSTANPPPAPVNITALDTANLVPADPVDASLPSSSTWVQFGMQYTANNQHYMFFNSSSWTPTPPGFTALGAIQNIGAQSSFASNTTALDLLSTQGGALGSQLSVVNPTIGTAELVINSLDDGDHPFHMHGHTFQILSVGDKYWAGDTSTLNMTNPMRRDTIVIPAYGHLVLRYQTNSPGIWVFHCHITWHMEIGLLLSVTNLPDQIAAFDVPQDMKDTCILDKDIGF